MSRQGEAGFTLIEVLLAMVLGLVILGATLTTYATFTRSEVKATKLTDAQDQARRSVDAMARQLRNLANPSQTGSSIDRADDYDFIFQTSDPARLRVRYCLAPAPAPGGVAENLWYQTTSAAGTFDPASATVCPGGSGWTNSRVVAQNIVNRVGGSRHVFSFGCSKDTPVGVYCSLDPATYPKVTLARTDLFLDINEATKAPAETGISTAVYLRNQNQAPTAAFAAVSGGSRTVALNGSGSSDPEERTLRYEWFLGNGPIEQPADCRPVPYTPPASPATPIGEGVTLSYVFPSGLSATQQIRLQVTDPGCLSTVSAPRNINPATGSPT